MNENMFKMNYFHNRNDYIFEGINKNLYQSTRFF